MPRNLTVRFGDLTLFDGNIEELVFTNNDQGITVQGRLKKSASASSGLLDLLTSAAKSKPKEDNTDG